MNLMGNMRIWIVMCVFDMSTVGCRCEFCQLYAILIVLPLNAHPGVLFSFDFSLATIKDSGRKLKSFSCARSIRLGVN